MSDLPTVLELNAFELGQISAVVDRDRLTEGLNLKIRLATAKVYLSSGYTKEQVFGEDYEEDELYKAWVEQNGEEK